MIGISWFVRTMKLTRFERMTLWISASLESHALPLRHSSSDFGLIGWWLAALWDNIRLKKVEKVEKSAKLA
jgi:hypothetical protein